MAAYITAYIDLEIICMPGTQKCQKTFIAFFHVLVPHPVIRVSMPEQKKPLMLLFTSKQTVIYVRPWGNFENENNLIIPCLCFINLNVIK